MREAITAMCPQSVRPPLRGNNHRKMRARVYEVFVDQAAMGPRPSDWTENDATAQNETYQSH